MNTTSDAPSVRRPPIVRGRVCLGIVVLLLVTRPPLTVAQTVTGAVTGVVVDARTRQPLTGALVGLGDPPQSMATDTEGRFRFEAVPVGSSELFVSLVGYALAKQAVEVRPEGADVTVMLTEGAAAFNERVTVQGSVFGRRELGVAGQQSLRAVNSGSSVA